ncbi:hypothetical protein IJU97_04975 [bacterium]|nr:hypothetical protein [bacterium]
MWDVNLYTITWKNNDGSVLLSSGYAYGSIPVLGFDPVDTTENITCSFA